MQVLLVYLFLGGNQLSVAQNQADSLWSFSKIRADVNADDTLDYLGQEVTITGIANIETGLLHEHYLQAFLQNDSSGMSVFAMEIEEPFRPGDSLVITGEIRRYNGLAEVHAQSYQVFKGKSQVPASEPLEKAVYYPEKYLGMLVEGEGRIVEKGRMYNGKYFKLALSDTSDQRMMIYVSNFHRLYKQFDFDVLSIGDKVAVKGILTEYNPDFPESRTFKVFLRTPDDLSYIGIPRYYLLLIIGGLVILSILAVGIMLFLKNQVTKKTASIQESLDEKEVLLREIHHRVKNSLAIVSGLIGIQMDSTNSVKAQEVLQDSQSRIQSMAMIHEKLYETESLSDIRLDNYLKELVEAIHGTFTEYNEAVDLQFDLETVELNIDKVIPCGLLINELVVNAFKHAFKKNEPGILKIKLQRSNGRIELIVADNGPGLAEDFSLNTTDSLGGMLINTFAAQLKAETKIANENGAEFTFTFSKN